MLVALSTGATGVLADWPEFRGPTRDGVALGKLPTEWSEQKNITWKRKVDGFGWSAPLIGGGKVWLTTATEDGTKMSVICLDEKSGDVLFDQVLITNDNPEALANKMNSYASSTGVLDGDRIYLHFGSYGTICMDTASREIVWQRRDFKCSHWRGAGSSLAMWEDQLFLTFDGADQQYLVSLDKKTGETLWRRDRSTDFDDIQEDGFPTRFGDFRKAYSTPIFIPVGNQIQVISTGAKACWAYDLKTGREIWNVTFANHSGSSRPVYSSELKTVFIDTGLGKPEIWAVKPDPGAKGDISRSHVIWKITKRAPKRASCVIENGLFFMASDGVISCADLKNGKIRWAERAGVGYSASLLANAGKVYFLDESGLCTVVKANREFQKLAENRLDDGFMASPAADGNALFLRTKTHLYRVESR